MTYVLSTLVAGPVAPETASTVAHWKLGPISLERPIATWGDSSRHLAAVNSLGVPASVRAGLYSTRSSGNSMRAGPGNPDEAFSAGARVCAAQKTAT